MKTNVKMAWAAVKNIFHKEVNKNRSDKEP